jgi:Family of unknown function (DUF5947)
VSRPQGLRRFTGPPGPSQPAAPPPVPSPVAEPEPAAGLDAQERCEFCATGIPAEHGHVADLEQSSLMCACRACYLLFTQPGAGRARYRSVPDRYLRDPDRVLTAAEWDELQIPVGLAFFLYRSERGELGCFYPSPAGATECALDLPAWQRLAAAHPLLGRAEPDVEAVLISQDDSASPGSRPPGTPRSPLRAEADDVGQEAGRSIEYYIVPIDACYELAGRMRMLWRGFDGGTEARESIAEFLAGVRKRARDAPQESSHG